MAEDVEMTPVEAEPPKANPLAKAVAKAPTLKLNPLAKPGLKLPTQTALKPGLKLPPKPGAGAAALKPGLKLPTQTALKPGIKLPPKPVIRKPGATVVAAPLPKPVVGAPAASAVPAQAPVAPAAPTAEAPKPMEALKSVTQKLKGITQEIPQQAILHKTGIIADDAMTEAQKEAAKHKTARISLSEAIGVAPVRNESAPMKTIRIKRPIDIPGATKPLAPQPTSAAATPPVQDDVQDPVEPAVPVVPAATITQRKTLKISRPGGVVRPAGKFGIKRPSQATTVARAPATPSEGAPAPADGAVADVADIPNLPPVAPVPSVADSVAEGPAWLWTLSALVQAAACVAIGALAWFLYQNTQVAYF